MTGLRKSLLPQNGTLPGAAARDASSDGVPAPVPSASLSPPAGGPLSSSQETSDVDLSLTFHPTEAMVRTKARWHTLLAGRPLLNGKEPTLALVKQVTRSAAIGGWWERPGFQEWFLAENSIDERLEWLTELSLRALEELLLNGDTRVQGARLNAAKLVADMSGRLKGAPAPDAVAKKIEAIRKMSREDIHRLLEAEGVRVEQVVQLPATPPSPETPSAKE